MLNGEGNDQAAIIDNLQAKLCKGFGRYRFTGDNKLEDPVVDAVYQAYLTFKENCNLTNLTSLEAKLSECKAADKKWFPYPEIQASLAEIRSSIERQSNGAGPRRAKP